MKRVDLVSVAAKEKVTLEVVVQELSSMIHDGESIGVYGEDGNTFLALSDEDVAELGRAMETKALGILDFANRHDISQAEAVGVLVKIANLRQIRPVVSVDELLFYTSKFLKEEFARILGES